MGPVLLSLFLLAPADDRLVIGSGVRLREGADANAKVVETVGFGTVLPCEARSPVVVIGGKSGVFCRIEAAYAPRWYFEPNTVGLEANSDRQLREEIDKRLKLLHNVDAKKHADVYDLQFFLLRRAQLDPSINGNERRLLVIDELDLVQSNPAAFAKDPRLAAEAPKGPRRLRKDVVDAALDGAADDVKAAARARLGEGVAGVGKTPPTPSAVTLVAMSLGLSEGQLSSLSTYQTLLETQAKKPTGEGWCALRDQASAVVGGLPAEAWTAEFELYEPRFSQLAAALPGIEIEYHSEGVLASTNEAELAHYAPPEVAAFIAGLGGLVDPYFSTGFEQVTDIQACFNPASFAAAVERAAAVWAKKVPSCVRADVETRLAEKFASVGGWSCFCPSADDVKKAQPAFDRAVAKFKSKTLQPPTLHLEGAQFSSECNF